MKRIAFAVLVLGLPAVPWLGADTLNVAGDAQTSSTQPNTKFGLLPIMTVRNAPTGAILNSYAKFDLSALPDAPTVDKTVLRLWANLVTTPGTIEVLPVLDPWQEGTITANSSPTLGSPVTSFAVSSAHNLHFIDVDITPLVQDWASGNLANNGLALRGVSRARSASSSRPRKASCSARRRSWRWRLRGVAECQGLQGRPAPRGLRVRKEIQASKVLRARPVRRVPRVPLDLRARPGRRRTRTRRASTMPIATSTAGTAR